MYPPPLTSTRYSYRLMCPPPAFQVKLLVAAAVNSTQQIVLREDALAALFQQTILALQAQLGTATNIGTSISQVVMWCMSEPPLTPNGV